MKPTNINSFKVSESMSLISVIVPAYNEEDNIRQLCTKLTDILSSLNILWEIILIDDGSEDGTWEEIVSLHEKDTHIKGGRLSRNYGHQYALFAGLSLASGNAVISMDADLQHPPHVIPQLVTEWRRGSKIVHTVRFDSESISLFKKVTSRLFYKVYAFLSGMEIESGMADFRLLDRQIVDALLQFREREPFLRGLVHWVGFPSAKVRYQCQERLNGVSKYTLRKMMKLGWSSLTSFSIIPLRIAIFIGVFTSLIAFGGLGFAVFGKIIGIVVPGWASIVSIISFLFGIVFILLGIVGEYIGQILLEVKSRPRFLMSEEIGIHDAERDELVSHLSQQYASSNSR